MFEKILVPYDGSEQAKKALDIAVELARKYNSKLYIIEVVDETVFENSGILPPLSAIEELRKKAQKDVEEAAKKAQGLEVVNEVLSGDPGSTILEYSSNNGISLIVMGSRGLSKFKRLLLGSVSTVVVNHSSVPVMIVK
ncbi:universal stress protein [Acidianus sulfidivorans JP7]|uniref:Universal stress protein UspA n=1 Tax=Acidianus sulfidivorans JP7 TaxID=619593 RepID=A0A2U9IPB5_9CREN|nr:universal stress protein [Acidianus sulfidivorans]AWR97852.1 universal stress protein [Acidianus sulfidivorans JP7]